jgi:hypothetical protein
MSPPLDASTLSPSTAADLTPADEGGDQAPRPSWLAADLVDLTKE